MEGSSHTIIHSTNLQRPRALAIDYQTQIIYWTDNNKLESSNTNGSNRIVLNSNLRNAYSMVFFNGALYWTDQSNRGIYTIQTSSPNNITLVLYTGNYLYGIQVFDKNVQFEGK